MSTAKVIITLDCPKNCLYCHTQQMTEYQAIDTLDNLLNYDKILIIGGEPLLYPKKLIRFFTELGTLGYQGDYFLYSSLYCKDLISIIDFVNGLHFTIPYEATDYDIISLKHLSKDLKHIENKSFKLTIDSRLYQKYDFSNIDFSCWNVVKKEIWQQKQSNRDEKLFYLKGW